MLKKVDRFVLKSFIGPLVLTFFIVLIILLLQFLWMYVDELAGKGLNFKILAELLFQFSLSFIPTALPLSVLLAALMTFGNMGEFSELSALKSSGISLQRIMIPLVILATLLCISSVVFSNYVLPYSNKKARTLLSDIRRKRPDINLQAGSFNNDIEGYSIKVGYKDPSTNRLEKLIIYDHTDKRGNVSVTYADSGYMKVTPDESAMIMVLYNGWSFTELEEKGVSASQKKYPSRKDIFREQKIVLSLSGFDLERSQSDLFKNTSWMMDMPTLKYFSDSLKHNYLIHQNTQLKDYNDTKLYLKRNLSVLKTIDNDTTKTTINRHKTFNAYALLDSLKPADRKRVLAVAIENLKEGNKFLNDKVETMKFEVRYIKKYEVDWHKKLTLPFACIVFFFIGAPLGAIIRKGGLGTPAVISILFFVIWYVISMSAEKLVEENLIGTIEGMWAASYILLSIGFFLTYKASNDSMILNIDTYLTFFKKIKDYVYKVTMIGNFKKQKTTCK